MEELLATLQAHVSQIVADCESARRALKEQADMADDIAIGLENREHCRRMWSRFTPEEGVEVQ